MKKTILIFSVLIIAVLSLFQLSKYSVLTGDLKIEWVIGIIAVLFFFIGIYLNKRSLHKTITSTSELQQADTAKLETLGVSHREYEILLEISKGLSNKEIADKLFISENTVKTHISNLFIKLDAKRRTQAIQRAKDLKIIV